MQTRNLRKCRSFQLEVWGGVFESEELVEADFLQAFVTGSCVEPVSSLVLNI